MAALATYFRAAVSRSPRAIEDRLQSFALFPVVLQFAVRL